MKTYKEVQVTTQELESITCDRCKKVYDDIMELQEFLNYSNDAGYGSVMGDGNELRMELCQHCVKEVLGPFIRVEGNYISNSFNRKAFFAHELPDETIEAIKNAKMDPKYNYLNDLLENHE